MVDRSHLVAFEVLDCSLALNGFGTRTKCPEIARFPVLGFFFRE
jgi:hypothetical protein